MEEKQNKINFSCKYNEVFNHLEIELMLYFAKNMAKNIGKNASKKLSDKYSQAPLDHVKH